MNVYNHASTAKIEIDYDEPYCNRGKLDTGTQCNYKCEFCYYIDQLDKVTPLKTIKERIDYLVECGITEVDLSGGESSIHKDWFEILDYARSHNLKISTLSNGSKFKNLEFLKKSQQHGLTEILFSVHGYNQESHDKMVGHKGGYKDIILAIHNAHSLGIKVRINCTVTKDNYQKVSTEFVNIVRQLNPLEVNFITLNYWDDANKHDAIDYNQITPEIKKAIDKLKNHIKYINVRYTPYCFMKGYEEYVCNYYQHIHDVYDWNIAVYDRNLTPKDYKGNELKYLYDFARINRTQHYYKTKECKECKHFYICDGVENQIKEIELHPEDGNKITQPNYYRRGFYETEHTDTNT